MLVHTSAPATVGSGADVVERVVVSVVGMEAEASCIAAKNWALASRTFWMEARSDEARLDAVLLLVAGLVVAAVAAAVEVC